MVIYGKFAYSLAGLCITFTLLCDYATLAQESTTAVDDTIDNLYNALLERDYVAPIANIFPNHIVERKSQRSPSLRLRWGKRTYPATVLHKRWFGQVYRQKPIRSPSLRLRFGRRSDPTVPLRSNFDEILSNLLLKTSFNAQNDDTLSEPFESMERKPQGLNWDRSLTENEDDNDKETMPQLNTDVIAAVLSSARVRNLLTKMRQYENNIANEDETLVYNNVNDGNAKDNTETDDSFTNNTSIDDINFQRDIRKNRSPVRLRFGRSLRKLSLTTEQDSPNTQTASKTSAENAVEKKEAELHMK